MYKKVKGGEKKNLDEKKFWVKKSFGWKKILDEKKFGVKKIFFENFEIGHR